MKETACEGTRPASYLIDDNRDDEAEHDNTNADRETVDVLVIIEKLVDLVGIFPSGFKVKDLICVDAFVGLNERRGEYGGDENCCNQ